MRQKTKYFKEVSTQLNSNDKYTQKQIEFYSKIPDVTRLLMYSVFEDILENVSEGTERFLDPCGGFMREPALLQIIGERKKKIEFTGSDVSEHMIENAIKIYPSLDGRLGVRTYDDYKNMISPRGFVTRFGLGYSENLSATLGGMYFNLQEGGYLLGVTSHGLLHEDMFLKKGYFEENTIELDLFWKEVQLKKPKYTWNNYEKVIKQYNYDKHFVFDGKEHPDKFSSNSPLDYTLFLLGKNSFNPISETTRLVARGIWTLERMMQINPKGDFSDYIMTDVNSYYKAKGNLIKLAKVPTPPHFSQNNQI